MQQNTMPTACFVALISCGRVIARVVASAVRLGHPGVGWGFPSNLGGFSLNTRIIAYFGRISVYFCRDLDTRKIHGEYTYFAAEFP